MGPLKGWLDHMAASSRGSSVASLYSAPADKRRAGARQGATKRRRGGWRMAGRKRRRVISDSESDDGDGGDGGDDGDGTNPNNNECGGDEVARSNTSGSAATASRAATPVTAQQAGTREMSGPGRGAGAPCGRRSAVGLMAVGSCGAWAHANQREAGCNGQRGVRGAVGRETRHLGGSRQAASRAQSGGSRLGITRQAHRSGRSHL